MKPKLIITTLSIEEDNCSYNELLDITTSADVFVVKKKIPRTEVAFNLSLCVLGTGNFGDYVGNDGKIDHGKFIVGLLNGEIKFKSIS